MPVLDGLSATQTILKMQAEGQIGSELKVVLNTAFNERLNRKQLEELKDVSMISKPIKSAELK